MKRRGFLARRDPTNGAATEEVLRRNPRKKVSVWRPRPPGRIEILRLLMAGKKLFGEQGVSCRWTNADISASPIIHWQSPTRNQLARNSEEYRFPHPKIQKGIQKSVNRG